MRCTERHYVNEFPLCLGDDDNQFSQIIPGQVVTFFWWRLGTHPNNA